MPTYRPRLSPAVAEIRSAVRAWLDRATADGVVRRGGTVLVGVSGGPDSLALASAVGFEATRADVRAGAVIVDHGLQDGSALVAERAAAVAADLGLDPVIVRRVAVGADGGTEAAARTARYAAFEEVAAETGATCVLVAHTLDDQAETVILGLLRGSGPDALSGMAPIARRRVDEHATTLPVAIGRPLLGVRRSATHTACADLGLDPWADPQNVDASFARVRVRAGLLPILEEELGVDVAPALARTADQLREDAAALDHFAQELAEELAEHAEAGIALSVPGLAANPAALRQRLVRLAVEGEFGVVLTRAQTLAVCRLVTDWSGQGPIHLPGVRAERSGLRVVFTRAGQ